MKVRARYLDVVKALSLGVVALGGTQRVLAAVQTRPPQVPVARSPDCPATLPVLGAACVREGQRCMYVTPQQRPPTEFECVCRASSARVSWACARVISSVPQRGPLPPPEVPEALLRAEAFFVPSSEAQSD